MIYPKKTTHHSHSKSKTRPAFDDSEISKNMRENKKGVLVKSSSFVNFDADVVVYALLLGANFRICE